MASTTPARALRWRVWLLAARPKTLPASLAPVLVGSSLALGAGRFDPAAFAAALLGALFIQVGTNLANDYSDARRGADNEQRIGPLRVTAQGLVPPRTVLLGANLAFLLAVLCGIYLIVKAGPLLLAVGGASIAAGFLYTGGPFPYGYAGLGEVFVFLFFGLVAVVGSWYVQVQSFPWPAFALAIPVGLLAAALLVVNNYRDIDSDRLVDKRTLAVRLGRRRTRRFYLALIALAYLTLPLALIGGRVQPWILLAFLSLPLAHPPTRTLFATREGRALNRALAQTALLQLAFCLLVSAGLLIGGGLHGR